MYRFWNTATGHYPQSPQRVTRGRRWRARRAVRESRSARCGPRSRTRHTLIRNPTRPLARLALRVCWSRPWNLGTCPVRRNGFWISKSWALDRGSGGSSPGDSRWEMNSPNRCALYACILAFCRCVDQWL